MAKTNLKAMLAKIYEPKRIVDKSIALQPKLNGQRAIYDAKQKKLFSRSGKLIVSVPHILEELKDCKLNLDGELYTHGESLQEILSQTRETVNINENSVQYHVYDHIELTTSFSYRYSELMTLFRGSSFKYLKLVETQFTSDNLVDVNNLNIYAPKYEGTMVRIADSKYIGKRSVGLMKIKDFMDDEFEIIDVEQLETYEKLIVPDGTPGSKKYSDGTSYKNGKATAQPMMGALVCKMMTGETFKVGTGFDDKLRTEFWKNPPIGKLATVRFMYYSDDGIPIHPSFQCLRDYD